MISAYTHLFHGDGRHSENPSNFLQSLKDSSANIPGISDSDKCQRFYLKCKADFDAEYWYEELESNSPMVLTSWPTFVKHFHVRWLGASPSSLLKPEPIISKKLDTATPITCKTTTTTVMNANTGITTTTTIPAPTSTAALAVYKTTTTPERVDRVAEAHHVIASPMLIPAQLEAEMTDASTDPSLSDIRATYTAVRQHGRAEEELEVERVEKLEVEAPGTGRERIEASTLDINEQEKMQSEVRAPAPSLTAHLVFDPMPHKPARFDWAAEVDEALGLSPFALSDCAAPVPANLALGNVPIDPVRTTCKGIARVDSIPVDPAPAPINSVPDDVAVDPDCTARTAAIPVDPDPVSPVLTEAAPANPVPANPVPANPVHTALTSAVPADPNPGDVATDASVALAKTAPTNLILTPDPARVKLDSTMPDVPIPVPIEPDPKPTALVGPTPCDVAINPVCTAFASVVPADSMPTDPNHVVRVNPIHITPTKPVHIDPVSVTFRALAPILFHFILFSSSVVRESQRESFRS
jgi:hypothetical protein